MAQPNVNFEVEIHVAERGDNLYAATIMPFHVTGYSNSFVGSIERAKKGLDRLLEEYEADGNLQQFLDESGGSASSVAEPCGESSVGCSSLLMFCPDCNVGVRSGASG